MNSLFEINGLKFTGLFSQKTAYNRAGFAIFVAVPIFIFSSLFFSSQALANRPAMDDSGEVNDGQVNNRVETITETETEEINKIIGMMPETPSSVENVEMRPEAPSSVESIEIRPEAASSAETVEMRPEAPSSVETVEMKPETPSSVETIIQQQTRQTGDVVQLPAKEMQAGETLNIRLLDFPRRGMVMNKVQQEYGQPITISNTIGQPPITHWTYHDRVVYFEYSTVLHVVAR